jgi:adenine-specific DNA-methyltransferase
MSLEALEKLRQESQWVLDAQKTQHERNKLGQFATPNDLAVEIMRHVQGTYRFDSGIRFLEPAFGTGSFYSALLQVFGRVERAFGMEIDPAVYERASELWMESGLDLKIADFTSASPPEKFNLLVTNPPYVRHHHIESEDKVRLTRCALLRLGLNVSALSGLYCHFIYRAHEWLEPDAVCVWLIPSEFMDVNYGSTLRHYLTSIVTLDQIHRFSPDDVQFTDALVSSAVVVFRNRRPSLDHKVRMTYGGGLDCPRLSEEVFAPELARARKWTTYPRDEGRPCADASGHPLGKLFTVKRGLATGSNRFFIMPRQRAREYGIPEHCLKPVLQSPRDLKQAIIEAEPDGYPRLEEQLAMIDCALPEALVQAQHPKFWEYLKRGVEQGVADGYLARGRKPWYRQEDRPPAPFLCTYLGRAKPGSSPFRFILNRSQATATNAYLMLYPNPEIKRALAELPELAERILDVLNATEAQSFFSEGRVYGGGLHKMEPKELMRLRLPSDIFEECRDQGVLAL